MELSEAEGWGRGGGGVQAEYRSHNERFQIRANTLSWGVTGHVRCGAKENKHKRALKSESDRHPIRC